MSRSLVKETVRSRAGLALAASLVAILAAAPAMAADKLYGLVVGIDDYIGTVNDLSGAVNDAEGIAASLQAVHADKIIKLINGAATKSTIQHAWYDLVHTAEPGDTIVFSYAGHGGQEPEPPGWQEPNGKSDNFLLANYEPSGQGSIERIVDWEMYQWLKAADDKGVQVVLVADSCHSGTMFRSVGSATIRYRKGKFADPDLASDLLELPPPELATQQEADFKHVTFIAATQDNMLTPELEIEGKPHGALSWAFAKAVSGAADTDHDGHLSQQELLGYLVPTVQTAAENQQIPNIVPLRPDVKPIMRAFVPSNGAAPAKEAVAAATGDDVVHLLVRGGVPAGLPEVAGIALTEDEATADLIWDRSKHTLDSRVGGRVAEGLKDGDMPAILSKASALAFIKARTSDNPVALSLASGNQTYKRGESVDIAMTGVRLPYLTLFNLPPNGRVEFFWPLEPEGNRERLAPGPFRAELQGRQAALRRREHGCHPDRPSRRWPCMRR